MGVFDTWTAVIGGAGTLLSLLAVVLIEYKNLKNANIKDLEREKRDLEAKEANGGIVHEDLYVKNVKKTIDDEIKEARGRWKTFVLYLLSFLFAVFAFIVGIEREHTLEQSPIESIRSAMPFVASDSVPTIAPEYSETELPTKTVRVEIVHAHWVYAYAYNHFNNRVVDFINSHTFELSRRLGRAYLLTDSDEIPHTRIESNMLIFENVSVEEYLLEFTLVESEHTEIIASDEENIIILIHMEDNFNLSVEPLILKVVDSNEQPIKDLDISFYNTEHSGEMRLRTNDFGLVPEYIFLDPSLNYRVSATLDSGEVQYFTISSEYLLNRNSNSFVVVIFER